MKTAVTIDDVAHLAGVSPKTVSRVVNGEANVREPTREAVRKAIAELGYRPNLAARSLAASRSFLIGLVTARLDNHYVREIHTLAVRACRERGLHLIVEEIDIDDPGSIRQLEHSIRQMRFEGVILTASVTDSAEVLQVIERAQISCVRLSQHADDRRFDAVTSDFEQGAQLLARHLWELGHRRIASAAVGRQRTLLRQELIALGADPDQIVDVPLSWRKAPIEAGRELGAAVLALDPRPTAVFAFNDEVAAGLIGYAWEHGVCVPKELSVVGYDDGEPAKTVWPPLTTVRQPLDEMLKAAVVLLTEPRNGGDGRKVVCPVELIARRSTQPVD